MKNLPTQLTKRILIGATLFGAFFVAGTLNKTVQSANLQTASVTLSNARLSFRGALGAGNSAGSSIVYIDTDPGDYPSTSSAQLVAGESVLIGEAGSLAAHTVASSSPDNIFTLDGSTLAAGDADAGDDVIATVSASLTVRFTTTNAIANGSFRVLVPALSNDAASSDGIPDGGYFDYGTTTPTVTCPTDVTNYTFAAGSAAVSSVTINGTDYHAFECGYTGSGGTSTAFTSNNMVIDSLINPAPDSSHALGTADTHNIIIQHLDASDNVIDSSAATVGVIEAVRVTASVPNQLSFRIIGVAASTSACGITTDVATTPTSVPFGELAIDTFKNAAHSLAVSTNAVNGYAVTAIANDQMGRDGAACAGADGTGSNTCIPDPSGANTAMSPSASDEWTAATDKGFAYTLHDNNSTTTEAFSYNTSSGNCTGTYCARQFADEAQSESAQTIFSSSSVADNHHLYVCYKAIVSATTAAGDYQNNIKYTATATF